MNYINIALYLIGIFILFKSLLIVMNLLGISFNNYINYILWGTAMIIFWFVLPKNNNVLFF